MLIFSMTAMKTLLYICIIVSTAVAETSKNDKPLVLSLASPRAPRIYAEAPKGVPVTQVRVNGVEGPCDPKYFVVPINETDFKHFEIDKCSGSITTKSSITRGIGSTYRLVIRASVNGSEDILSEVQVAVTPYNKHPPSFPQNIYSQEVLDIAPPGTFLMNLQAKDSDSDEFSKEIYYFIKDTTQPKLNIWSIPSKCPISINVTTGRLELKSSLAGHPTTLGYVIGAADGGSPQRSSFTKVTLHIRNMSAPRDVEIVRTMERSVLFCWRAPLFGHPEGYQITYTQATDKTKQKKLVLTTPEILNITETLLPIIGLDRYANYQRTKNEEKVLNPRRNHFCINIEDLEPSTLYSVSIRGWASGNRLSMTKEPFTVLTRRKVCTKYACENGVCQEQMDSPGFHCKCIDGYTGDRCQHVDPCLHFNLKCVHGKCNRTANTRPMCECEIGYIGERCDKLDICTMENPCQNGGTCSQNTRSKSNTFKCDCPEFYTGFRCETRREHNGMCPNETTTRENTEFQWPQTPVNVEISIKCPQSSNEREKIVVTRLCSHIKEGVPAWAPPDYSKCDQVALRKQQEARLEEEQISNLSAIDLNPSISGKVLERFVDKLSSVVNTKITSKKVAKKVAKMMSNLLRRGKSLVGSENNYATSGKIRKAIESFTSNVVLEPGEEIHLKEDNLVIAAKVLKKAEVPSEVDFSPSDEQNSKFQNGRSMPVETLWLKIPKSAIEELHEDNIRFQFVSFDNDHIFRGKNKMKSLNMPVISATVANAQLQHLNTPVTYTLPLNATDDVDAKCVFWDTVDETWSMDGLTTKLSDDGHLVCESTHLTAFSVLLDPVAASYGDHSEILSIITYVLLGLSTIALSVTIATFALFKSLRRDRSGIIVMNLALSLLLLNVSFIFVSCSNPSYSWCPLLGALLHYCVLAAFFWMLIEAKNMHQLLVTVFPSVETHYILKRLILGWGAPIVFVLVACIWDTNVYRNDNVDFCVMTATKSPVVYYITYFVPICVILVVNCVVFVLVARILCQRRPGSLKQKSLQNISHKRSPVTLAQLRGAVTVVALLGVTWVLGALAIGPLRIVFQYIFCLTTPLQGLIIFMVRVIQSGEARNSWYCFLKNGSRRSRQTPSSQQTHSSTQHSSMHTQSTGTTPGMSVINSAVRAARKLSLVNNFGVKSKLSNAKKPIEKRKSSAPMLPKDSPPTISKPKTEQNFANPADDEFEDTRNLQRTGSDLLLSISKLIPLNLDENDHTRIRKVSSDNNPGNGELDVAKSVQPYQTNNAPHITRSSSEMVIFADKEMSNRRVSLSSNNLDDIKLAQQTQLLNPD